VVTHQLDTSAKENDRQCFELILCVGPKVSVCLVLLQRRDVVSREVLGVAGVALGRIDLCLEKNPVELGPLPDEVEVGAKASLLALQIGRTPYPLSKVLEQDLAKFGQQLIEDVLLRFEVVVEGSLRNL